MLARSPMGDLTGALWITAGVLSLLRYRDDGKLGWGTFGALLLGLAVCYRVGNLLFAPIVVVAWMLVRQQTKRPLLHALVVGGGYLCGLGPLLVYHAFTFGHPLATGYALWVPQVSDFLSAFQIGHVPDNVRYLGRELLQVEWKTTVATMYGHGSYFGPAGILLLGWCVVRGLKRRSTRWFAIGVAGYPVAMVFYFFQDARLFAPLFPLASVFVAVEVGAILRRGGVRSRTLTTVLLAAHILGFPGSHAVFELPGYLASSPAGKTPRYTLVSQLRTEEPGLVLSTFSPPYVHALLGDPWVVAPARDKHGYRFNTRAFHFSAVERWAIVQRARSKGRSVYLIADENLAGAMDVNPPPANTVWSTLVSGEHGGGLARLTNRR